MTNWKIRPPLLVLCSALGIACTEPLSPPDAVRNLPREEGRSYAVATCRVDVGRASVSCDDFKPVAVTPDGARASIVVGNQDLNIKLASSGTVYDSGTRILSSNVIVQNLLQQSIGTSDGITIDGVKIFFNSGPTVTAGTGNVLVFNADGVDAFTAPGQSYFSYDQILSPYEISDPKFWEFSVDPTVTSFAFTLLISTKVADEGATFVDRMWNGSVSTAWDDASNWTGGVPVSTSVVAIPPASKLGSGQQPSLVSSVTVLHLRVGGGSTLNLASNTLDVDGNLDAPGAITNGSVNLNGANALLGGTVSSLMVKGNARLQRALTATGSVSVSGSLTGKDHPITIAIQ